MDLKVPIKISDELSEDIVDSTGLLDLASGEIYRIEYEDYDLEGRGLPADSDDYEFTVGTLSNNGKDVEFKVDVNKVTGQYSVSASELLEIKVRAAAALASTLRSMSLPLMPANRAAARTLISSSSLALTEYCPVTLLTSILNSTSLPLFDSVPTVNS